MYSPDDINEMMNEITYEKAYDIATKLCPDMEERNARKFDKLVEEIYFQIWEQYE